MSQTVLITGLNGFVAVHTATVFLQNGWKVKGTVRSQDKIDKVKSLPALEKSVKDGKVEVVILEDLIKGDYTEIFKGVDAIAHCASPWHFKGENWAAYRDPAVGGTTNILEQAAKVDSIKAVSVISSFAAIVSLDKPATEQGGKVYTENDWLRQSEQDCEDMTGKDMAPVVWYCASKKFAELAAREAVKKTGAKYSLGTVCPPMIFGPAIHFSKATGKDLSDSDVSTTMLYNTFASGKDGKIPDTSFPIYADVRNVAQVLYEVIAKKSNGRFPVSNGNYDYQSFADRARELYPDLEKQGVIPKGDIKNKIDPKNTYTLDGSKITKELGVSYLTTDETIKDTIEQLKTLGVIQV